MKVSLSSPEEAVSLFAKAGNLMKAPFLSQAWLRQFVTPLQLKRYDKLHLGSGARLLEAWGNIDINGLGNLVWDLRKPLPLKERQIRYIYTEHFIEHVQRSDTVLLLTNARQAMLPGAVLRVSTPDLRKLADDYLSGRIVHMPHGGWYPETPCQMLNEAVRDWGHTFLYDENELVALLSECGFSDIRRVAWGESDHVELRGLESRPDFGDLILEARA